MGDVPIDEIAARRAMKRAEEDNTALSMTPLEVLETMVLDLRAGKFKPKHLIVCVADEREEGGVGTMYRQAGTLGYYGAMGLLARAQMMIGEN